MSLTTCAVSVRLYQQDGVTPDVGATVTARLKGFEVESGVGYIVPDEVTAEADATGLATLDLWPNELGSVESSYDIIIEASNGRTLRTTAVVPNQPTATLESIAVLPPFPGKVDGQIAVEEAAGSAAAAHTSELNAAASAAAAAASEASAATHETNAGNSAAAAAASEAAAASHETNAGNSAAAAAASEASAAMHDTNAGNSAAAAAASEAAAATHDTNAGNSAAAAAASEASAAASAAQADADKTQTGLDRTQTGLDVQSATAAQAQANSFMLTAIAQASLATVMAAASASAVQQDISGVTASALHRSPNAVVAQCIYDTRYDDDGGAWVDKVGHLSYSMETLQGAWIDHAHYGPLGCQNELNARCYKANVGGEMITADTTLATATGWTVNPGVTVGAGAITMTAAPSGNEAVATATAASAGVIYRISINIASLTQGKVRVFAGAVSTDFAVAGNHTFYFAANAGGGANVQVWAVGVTTATITALSIKPVTSLTTTSGAYYGDATDGKFKRLWKNLLKYSEDFTQAAWVKSSITPTYGVADPNGGTAAVRLTATANGAAMYQGISPPVAQTPGINSIMVRRVSGTGTVKLSGPDGLTSTDITASLNGTWQRFNSPSTLPAAGTWYGPQVVIGTAGDVVEVAFPQTEIGATATAYEQKLTGDAGWSEVFRGNQAKPPRIWGIVAEASRVVIYALDLPGRPMWMVFTSGGSYPVMQALGRAPATASRSCVAALNGLLLVGTASNAAEALTAIDFTKDRLRVYSVTNNGYDWLGNIAQRNSTMPLQLNSSLSGLAHATVNAVSMCLMPDAPCDPVTGLRVPTIAVATAGGISVIQNTGTVVNSAVTSNFNGGIIITPYLVAAGLSGDYLVRYALNPKALGAAFTLTTTNSWDMGGGVNGQTKSTATASQRNVLARTGVTIDRFLLLRLNEVNPSAHLSAAISSSFNTGWMAGDVRRAYLCDTSVGVVSSVNQITNGTFNTDISGWSAWNAGAAWNGSGALRATGAGGGAGGYQDVPTVAGKTYSVKADWTRVTGTGTTGLAVYDGGGFTTNLGGSTTTGQVVTFTAKSASTRIYLYCVTTGDQTDFDSVVLMDAVLDRSYKASRLVPFGTLTRSQVNTGSQLTAISGFSAANYLQEAAHSADLDFGTGPIRWTDWVNVPANLQLYQNLAPMSSVFGAANTMWTQDGVSVADGDLVSGGYTFAKLQQPAASTGGNRIWWASPKTPIGVPVNLSWLVRRVAGSTDRLQLTMGGQWSDNSTHVFDPVSQTFTSGGAGWTVTVVDANTVRLSKALPKSANGSSAFVVFQVARASDGAPFGGGTGGVHTSAMQMTVGSSLLSYEDVPGSSVLVRCHPTKEYSYSNGAYVTLGLGGDGFPMVELYDTVTRRTASLSASSSNTVGANYATGQWMKLCGEYDTSGTLTLKINGTRVAQATGNPLLTLTNASAVLTVGQNYALNAPFPGSIALSKIGATAVSDDASSFMFAQEAEMFQAGAQVCLPDSGSLVDLSYDRSRDSWKTVSAANEASFTGLVQTAQSPVPAGSFTKCAHESGCKLLARSTTNPGVDVTIAPWALREELYRRAEDAARQAHVNEMFDWNGQFTANTVAAAVNMNSPTGLVYPQGASIKGAVFFSTVFTNGTSISEIDAAGTPRGTAVAAATATSTPIQFYDFILPVGYEARDVFAAGLLKREGAANDYTRMYDGFRERVRFAVAPGNVHVRVNARRMQA